jgi:hypothetical protein
MPNLPLRSIFSSILLGHLGAAATLSGCVIVAEPDDPVVVPNPDGTGGKSGTSGSAGKSGTSGSAGKSGTSGSAGAAGAGGSATGGSAGAAGAGGVGGQGGAGGGYTVISSEGFEPMSCSPLLAGAAANLGVDSIELWEAPYLPGGTSITLRDSDGVACGGASDQPACLASLEAIRAQEEWDEALQVQVVGAFLRERFVLTEGDEVKVVDSKAELSALLGPIDSLEKLRLVGHYAPTVGCEYVRRTERGYEVIGQRLVTDCPITYQRRLVEVTTEGEVTVLAQEQPSEQGGCAGRRPAGLGEQAVGSASALARYLERQAYLEGASVEAFERFARELEGFGAPSELAQRARQARADEVRHHALLVALGRRFDPSFACAEPVAAPATHRSLYAFALENAVEGCVRETWGALLAHHQAARAADGAVRCACALIADDETKHAELSWAAHAWLLGQLSEGERAAIEGAMREAAAELLGELAVGGGLSAGERAQLGLPSVAEACALMDSLYEQLWARPLAA